MVGGDTYTLLHNLFTPENPKDQTYTEIVEKLKSHYEPKPLSIAQQFHFHKRNQGLSESIAQYMTDLRHLAGSCEFENLDQALRD